MVLWFGYVLPADVYGLMSNTTAYITCIPCVWSEGSGGIRVVVVDDHVQAVDGVVVLG